MHVNHLHFFPDSGNWPGAFNRIFPDLRMSPLPTPLNHGGQGPCPHTEPVPHNHPQVGSVPTLLGIRAPYILPRVLIPLLASP